MKHLIPSLLLLFILASTAYGQAELSSTGADVVVPGSSESPTYGVNRKSNVIQYPYGYDPQPILKCSPLRVSYVLLEVGELVQDVDPGDPVRWTYEVGYQGPQGRQRPMIKVKPKSFNTTTNLLITTNRRIYDITLDAPRETSGSTNPQTFYTRRISFYYPDDAFSSDDKPDIPKPDSVQKAQAQQDSVNIDTSGPLKEGVVDMSTAHLNYKVKQGRYPFDWEPLLVYDNRTHLFIKIPSSVDAASLPSMYKVNGAGERELINYIFNPETNTMKSDRILKEVVLIERFRHPGFLGIGTVTKERELFITRKP